MRPYLRTTAILLALCGIFVCTVGFGARPKKLDRRVLARLSGKSESVRQQATLEIKQFAKLKFRYLPELIEAVRMNCEQLDSDLDEDSDELTTMSSVSRPG